MESQHKNTPFFSSMFGLRGVQAFFLFTGQGFGRV